MILNALSITLVFIGLLSALLAIWGGMTSILLYKKWGTSSTSEERTALEERSYLVLLIMVVGLSIRLISWPLFYATLQSFIHEIEGAMCIFGVTRVKPGLTRFLEFLKPINFFLIGGWMMLHILDRATQTSPLIKRKLLLLSMILLFVLADSLGDILLMIGISPGTLVSCCTTVTDISSRPTRTTPESIFGAGYAQSLKVLFLVSHLFLTGWIGFSLKFKKLENAFPWRRQFLGIIFLLALANAVLFVLSQIEVFAPAMMGLPFHHCLYCLWQYAPHSMAIYLSFILGTFSAGWGYTTDLFGRRGEGIHLLPVYLRKIYGFSFFCLSASLIMLLIGLLAG